MPNNRLAKESREELKGLDAAGLRAKLDESRLKLWQLQFLWVSDSWRTRQSWRRRASRLLGF